MLSRQHYVAQGGSGVVVYRVDASALADGGRDGVQATVPADGAGEDPGGDQAGEPTVRFFPGYPMPGGEAGERFALFGAPHDLADAAGLRLVAADAMGNQAEVALHRPAGSHARPTPTRSG